uniref:Sugar phosphate transporter domain-containing protein n=1 Tax=Odontella aurita TaxID=265563 RepID=A0A7S4I5X1_9STRA|mmetsp:Transcript_20422/g.59114  ORF Transcript_20422/g.59114 Transcript_20422/m.59114 type:complete len:363 (+) Transcript_20422:284-1372(+)|eukprot:CAMPEP_0113527128 /NCGR_PEP_ID=MMETSP0015_2-20120614/1127_1 /TAXON_ID=2838 /ORGANISM="Odontella" /LENGTH=362 /DNA_ID=CAMNT_0000425535 /DNA_START=184 /DNA_END=1272 /DNA_ORIENTATION=- /assembly_acc=CAM_ASM_000160
MSDHMYIASVVMTYWFVSISMVYLNKVLMSNEGMSIPAPLFVTWYQCIITALICWIAGKCGERAQARESYHAVSTAEGGGSNRTSSSGQPRPSFFAQFPRATYDMSVARRIFPLSIIFVGMITFNNLCLKWVEVSFYNVARSLTIVFNVFFSYALLGIPSSCRTVSCLFVVVLGFFVGGYGEINFSLLGTCAGVMSSLFVSLNSIFTKKVLPVVDDNHWRLTFYNNVNACFLFIPLIAYFEGESIMKHVDDQLVSATFWSAMTVAGFFGFSIGIVTVLQIKATSPLSHNISGTAKAAVQSLMAFYIWGNEATVLGVLGIFTVLGGSLLYTIVKMNENRAAMPHMALPPREPSNDVEKAVPVK